MVTKIIDQSDKWINDENRTWQNGLDIAETAAHLLESAELTAMRTPPTWEVEMLRQGEIKMEALKELIIKLKNQLEPYKIVPPQNN